ncbi:MAG: permease [Anaerolineaceae bacterium]|nr:permease [Anaerolineaceae bacterium]MCB9100664.1 permease [Anaerolineales bacterium]
MKLLPQTPVGQTPEAGAGRFSRIQAGLRHGLARWREDWKVLAAITSVFVLIYYLPLGNRRFDNAVIEGLYLAQWYAQEHVLLCLIPAFFIAGGISVFVSQASVMRYLGAGAPKVLAYGVASVSGTILAVCSCTVLPLFAGIYRMGAGLGPAVAFLYSGPAINVLAIILTASVLGPELGLARAIGAIGFSLVIGLLMHVIFIKEEREKSRLQATLPTPEVTRPLWQNGIYFAAMVGMLVFVNWGKPQTDSTLWALIYQSRWLITAGLAVVFGLSLVRWFGIPWGEMAGLAAVTGLTVLLTPHRPTIPFVVGVAGLAVLINRSGDRPADDELAEWWRQSWGFAKQILPLLLAGVLISGFLLGRPGHEGLIPSTWVAWAVGGNSLWANFVASFLGAFMYFATLTEVPILQGLLGSGMGKGPALALLLAGPALSLPNMLVIRSILGAQKTVVFVTLVIMMATISGLIYGTFFG